MEPSTQLPNPPTATTEGDFTLAAALNDRGHNNRAPIHCLPPELLSIIIQEVHSGQSYRMLFAIRFVCSLWMKFIDSSPEFWCSISLEHKPNLLMMLLRNSKSRPLSVQYSPDRIYEEEEQITDFFQLVTPSIGRWKTLEYSRYWSPFDERIISLLLQNLETLIVDLGGIPTPVHYNGFLDAPKLQQIKFNSFTLDWRTIPNLRVVELSGIDIGLLVDHLHLLFKASPSLESLDIRADFLFSTNRNLSDLPQTPNLLPKLQRIFVCQLQPGPCSRLLDLIDCPNLRHFYFLASHKPDPGSESLASALEPMGRFIGGPRQPGHDDSTKLLVGKYASCFIIELGFRRAHLFKEDTWDEQNHQQDCQNGLSASLRKFDGRTIKGISKIILRGIRHQQDMIGLCLILHRYCPSVTKLQVDLSSLQDDSDGYPVLEWLSSPLPLGDGGGWLFPKLTSLHIDASERSICDGILRTVEGRQTGGAQAIREVEIQKGKVGRGTVDKLKIYLQDLRMVGTEVL
ncbi:hypothetical protein FRC04_010512 [Tulasnella sp. 424]|nr:hypothetical protein FRC04_010512 [Tulasnella sp. 424]KAG8976862.1 hypothetical protein FRC05_002799 [Tulasnella sp. 425]